MRTIVFGSLLLFVLQACGNASSLEYESGDGTARHVSIAYLKSLCRGVLYPVTEDLWIEGCVVGNDICTANFPMRSSWRMKAAESKY